MRRSWFEINQMIRSLGLLHPIPREWHRIKVFYNIIEKESHPSAQRVPHITLHDVLRIIKLVDFKMEWDGYWETDDGDAYFGGRRAGWGDGGCM